jgi:hypothetical protein
MSEASILKKESFNRFSLIQNIAGTMGTDKGNYLI